MGVGSGDLETLENLFRMVDYHLQRKCVANFSIQKIPSAMLVIVVVSVQSHVLIRLKRSYIVLR